MRIKVNVSILFEKEIKLAEYKLSRTKAQKRHITMNKTHHITINKNPALTGLVMGSGAPCTTAEEVRPLALLCTTSLCCVAASAGTVTLYTCRGRESATKRGKGRETKMRLHTAKKQEASLLYYAKLNWPTQ